MPEDNDRILTLLYVILSWHGLAKLRLHSDITLKLLRQETIRLGKELRMFQSEVCSRYETYETPKEAASRVRAAASRMQSAGAPANVEGLGARRRRTFNLSTSKIHALGDYVDEIITYGTTDNFSTQLVRFFPGSFPLQIHNDSPVFRENMNTGA